MNDRPPSRRQKSFATMSDVAKKSGVSLMTVSRAYRDPGSLSPATLQKVLATAEKLGYVQNLVAGNLASGRTSMVAVVVPSLRNSHNATSIQGLADRLRASAYQFMVTNCGYSLVEEAAAVEAYVRRRPDGIILTGTRHNEQTRELLRSTTMPVVETWETNGPFIDMAVGFSNYQAGRDITRHLIGTGCRTIGYVDYPAAGLKRFDERKLGFQDELTNAGLAADIVIQPKAVSDDHTPEFAAGAEALDALLRTTPALDAILCATDVLAVGVLFECQRRNIKVPDELSVAGFGDFEIAAAVHPGLTTVKTRGYQIGWNAADLLISRIEGKPTEQRVCDVGYDIVYRDSTKAAI
jgi:LacI family transcriptional regulator, gluconate utilization system Gnt-I transcriptional repressor